MKSYKHHSQIPTLPDVQHQTVQIFILPLCPQKISQVSAAVHSTQNNYSNVFIVTSEVLYLVSLDISSFRPLPPPSPLDPAFRVQMKR